jgi:3-chloro-4-hydroxyphenylacetate reductive dehalogenase
MSNRNYPKILRDNSQLGPYPMEKLKRVDVPTTLITENIQRPDQRETGFARAARGDYGPKLVQEFPKFVSKYPLGAALSDMVKVMSQKANGDIFGVKSPLAEDPLILSRHIKSLGYFLRADIMGICELPQYAVYTHNNDGSPIDLNHKYAITIVVDQGYETMAGSTGYDWISGSQSYRGYSTTAFIAEIIADYIRRLGYAAYPHHSRTYKVVIPPLLVLSGIGEMSRMGNSVINPFLGARFKAAAVTTDLPLLVDQPLDFGLQEFCRVCKKCAQYCNSKAIPFGDKVIYNGYECWKLDVERCSKFRIGNQLGSSCGTCIKVCPWNKPPGLIHDAVRWIVKNTPFLDRTIVKMDNLMDYAKAQPEKQWWFDL